MNTHPNTHPHTNISKTLVYTILVFLVLCLASYLAGAQPLSKDGRPPRNIQELNNAFQPALNTRPAHNLASSQDILPLQPGKKNISLEEALSLAMGHNREIRLASLDIERSGQEKIIAKSLSLPSAGLNGQVDHYFLAPVFFGFGSSTTAGDKIPYGRFGGKDQFSASLWVSQPLYNPSSKPSLRRSEKAEEQSRQLLRDKQSETSARVRQTYLQVLVLRERIRLQRESLSRNEKALEDARSLLAQGRALRVDTLRAFTSVKNLEPDLLRLSYSIEVGTLQLKTLMGVDSLQEIELSDSLTLPSAASLPSDEEVYADAEKNRPDLQALTLQTAIDDQQILLAGAAKKPSVSLVGQYLVQTQASKFNYFNSLYPTTPFVGAQVSVPLFSGFSNQARIREAKMTRQQSTLRVDNAHEQLRALVRQAVANALEASSRIKTRVTVKEAASLSYDITQYRYANGVASRLELTDAELALTTAQSNYLEAVYDYLAAQIELDRVRGR